MEAKYCLVFAAVPKGEGEKIQEQLVKERLAACVKIVPEVSSCYTWKGKMEKEKEALLIIEIKTSLLDKVFETIRKNHPYETPAISAVPIIKGNPGYLKWVDEVTEK